MVEQDTRSKQMTREIITVVSGLPRSGTSMMMRMLHAGGMSVLTDNIRQANVDNPKGYYEFERVKKLEHDRAWLPDAQGKAVKIIATLLRHLPPDYAYQVIFMRRNMAEILASQKRMLVRRGEASDRVDDERMAELFRQHVARVETWLARQSNFEVLYVDYNETQAAPLEQAQRINRFLGGALDANKMAAVVDPALYRQRS